MHDMHQRLENKGFLIFLGVETTRAVTVTAVAKTRVLLNKYFALEERVYAIFWIFGVYSASNCKDSLVISRHVQGLTTHMSHAIAYDSITT